MRRNVLYVGSDLATNRKPPSFKPLLHLRSSATSACSTPQFPPRPASHSICADHELTMRNKNGGKMETASTAPQTNSTQMTDKPTMAASAKRSLPPEKPEAIWTRTLVISAFWAVIIFLGLPMWWKTTSIYRARLPLDEMKDWADGKVSSKTYVSFLMTDRYISYISMDIRKHESDISHGIGLSTGLPLTDSRTCSVNEHA